MTFFKIWIYQQNRLFLHLRKTQNVMQRYFNTECACNPDRDYMVDITEKFLKTRRLIDNAKYFCINRARQFGKTTMLSTINKNLREDYLVVSISFEDILNEIWQDTCKFCQVFCSKISFAMMMLDKANNDYIDYWEKASEEMLDFEILSTKIQKFCLRSSQKIVLLIDEVDNASNNDLFVKFLGILRNLYNQRIQTSNYKLTFYSVILVGVYDIRHLKLKIRPDEESQNNSPWNVAAEYNVDLSFVPSDIANMLSAYEADHHTGMDIESISNDIYKYTSGYPVLVSAVCKYIDENELEWTADSVQKSVKMIITNDDFSLTKNLIKYIEDYNDLKTLLKAMLLDDFTFDYEAKNPPARIAKMFAIISKDQYGKAKIHNIIFQQVLYNYFINEEIFAKLKKEPIKSQFIQNGTLNMENIIRRFSDLMHEEYRDRDQKFIEQQGRLLFLCFLKPIINGTGFYYVEPQTRENARMDLVVTYNHKEYIIELKIWHGTKYEPDGKIQLAEYLETRGADEGYLVTFSFLKNKTEEEPEWKEQDGKRIFEAVI